MICPVCYSGMWMRSLIVGVRLTISAPFLKYINAKIILVGLGGAEPLAPSPLIYVPDATSQKNETKPKNVEITRDASVCLFVTR